MPNHAGIARIIAGSCENTSGAANTFTPLNVWDLRLEKNRTLRLDLPAGHTVALYILSGALKVGTETIHTTEMAVFEQEKTTVVADIIDQAVVLLLSGKPLNEPICGQGPFVMNTREEITQALQDFKNGEFGQIPLTSASQ